ncbi:hypothetical protein [Desulfobacula toluolica]|uniref:Uncharacterized protein n=1 Tax=Desulfobacula toluolica (strain DSM 7467 / Tol2) TaxID=651182 RepID=K0NIJ6_DESTT|nr:hypothetical protein [Desulfobacula toluolica]CCK81231.1 uncharacterized protein TOL2_C30740 [Desulfobacula toluolica Tol2]
MESLTNDQKIRILDIAKELDIKGANLDRKNVAEKYKELRDLVSESVEGVFKPRQRRVDDHHHGLYDFEKFLRTIVRTDDDYWIICEKVRELFKQLVA